MLQDAENNWHFDIFAFADATPGTTLAVMTFHLLKQAGCINEINLDQGKLWNFLQKIEGGYRVENPYQQRACSVGGADDTHATAPWRASKDWSYRQDAALLLLLVGRRA